MIRGYELIRPLGRGAAGVVYLARRSDDGTPVALKHLAEGNADARAVSRLRREAAALAAIDHIGVVHIVEIVDDGADLWLAMEHVPGVTLGALRPLTRPAALCALAQLANALDAVHDRGIVHRDIKPTNVLVDPHKVDVGSSTSASHGSSPTRSTARHGGGLHTDTGTVLGTPRYLAPELLDARTAGRACDIYSLAVVAYELVVGRVPFDDEGVLSLLDAHRHRPPPDPAALDRSLEGPMAAALLAGLAKEPGARRKPPRPGGSRSPTPPPRRASSGASADPSSSRPPPITSHAPTSTVSMSPTTATRRPEPNTAGHGSKLPRARLPVFRGHRRRRWALGAFAFAVASLTGYVLVHIH